MATQKTTVAAHTAPAPIEPTPTGPITLPEMPPAETFQGLITYAVDTATNQSKQLPLDFLADGVAACIDATADAIEATENLTDDVSALVLTPANKPRIQELAGIVPTRNYVTDGATTNTTYTWYSTNASSTNANPIGAMAEQLKIGDWVCLQADIKATGEVRYQINLGSGGTDIILDNTGGKFVRVFTTRQIKTQAELNSLSLPFNGGAAQFSLYIESGTAEIKNRLIGVGNQPVDWFPAYGIDYSLLTEQVVPGEFWKDIGDSTPRKVCRRTFQRELTFTALNGNSFADAILTSASVWTVLGSIGVYAVGTGTAFELHGSPDTNVGLRVLPSGDLYLAVWSLASNVGKKIRLTINAKYTKI